jgi:hypothetical protein
MLENKLLGKMINIETGKEFSLAEFFNKQVEDINNEVSGGFDIDASEDNPMVRITVDKSDGTVQIINLVSEHDYPRYLELMSIKEEPNTLRNMLESIGFVTNLLSHKDVDGRIDSYHLELKAPATDAYYMFSIFDTLFAKHGNVNRELQVAFETLDKDGDHNEVVTTFVDSDVILDLMR